MTQTSTSRRRRWWVAGVGVLLAAVAVVGGGLAAPTVLRVSGAWVDGGRPEIDPSVFAPPPSPEPLPDEGVAGPALGVKPQASAQAAGVLGAVSALPLDGVGTTSWVVVDPEKGVLAGRDASAMLMPASTLKLLTGLAALDVLPAEQTFATRVLQPKAGSIVLVGGGDPMLTNDAVTTGYPRPASLSGLADTTAAALKAAGQTSVSLSFDARLFTGPDWEPTWEPVFETDVTRVSALMADVGVHPATRARTKTPAADAAASFAEQLRQRGITVAASIAPGEGAGEELASVSSLPVRVLVQHALLTSDNTITEAIGRHVAIASGKPASFAGEVVALQDHLTSLGVWRSGAVLYDGSGVSRQSRVSAEMLAEAISVVVHEPKYRPLLDALPVAGVTGTLRNRFTVDGSGLGRGWVRAKTGSLRDASALAGFARTADDQLLAFAFISNGFTDAQAAKTWIDTGAATIAACGCK